MLQTLRDKTSGWIAFVILAAVSIPFAFFGINNYFEAQTDTAVAHVGDEEITPDEFREVLDRVRARAQQQQGEAFDAAQFDDPIVKRRILDQMIDEELLVQAAKKGRTEVSDARVADEIRKTSAFHGADGQFDANLYRTALAGQGMSPQMWQEEVRRSLSIQELPMNLSRSALVTDAQVDRFLTLEKQARDFRYALVPQQQPEKQPTEEEIKAYYDANQSQFMTEEQVALEYVEVNAADLAVEGTPTEDALRQRYDEQKARYVTNEQRLASHILVKVDPNADADAQKAAQAKAADIAAKAKAGEDFAKLAQENSDDIGSKAQGGDLGWLEKGMTEPAFETALFALEAGAVSDPVKTDEGYHVIVAREVKPEIVKTFEEARAELESEFASTERERRYNEISGDLVDRAYADPDNLATIASDMKLDVKRTGLFGRQGGTDPITQNPLVLRAAFSEAVLVEGTASDALPLGENHIAIVRVAEHKPSVPRPLEEVREQVVARINEEAARTRTEALAESLRQKAVSGASIDALAGEVSAPVETAAGITRNALNLDAALVAEVFELARPAGKPVTAIVDLRPGAHAIVELTAVKDGDPTTADQAERDRAKQQLLFAQQGVEMRALLASLREEVEVRVAEDRL